MWSVIKTLKILCLYPLTVFSFARNGDVQRHETGFPILTKSALFVRNGTRSEEEVNLLGPDLWFIYIKQMIPHASMTWCYSVSAKTKRETPQAGNEMLDKIRHHYSYFLQNLYFLSCSDANLIATHQLTSFHVLNFMYMGKSWEPEKIWNIEIQKRFGFAFRELQLGKLLAKHMI